MTALERIAAQLEDMARQLRSGEITPPEDVRHIAHQLEAQIELRDL